MTHRGGASPSPVYILFVIERMVIYYKYVSTHWVKNMSNLTAAQSEELILSEVPERIKEPLREFMELAEEDDMFVFCPNFAKGEYEHYFSDTHYTHQPRCPASPTSELTESSVIVMGRFLFRWASSDLISKAPDLQPATKNCLGEVAHVMGKPAIFGIVGSDPAAIRFYYYARNADGVWTTHSMAVYDLLL
jgi:hypothetical protein